MLVNEINLQEIVNDISFFINKKKKMENHPNRKNNSEFEKIKNKIKINYLKTCDSNTVIDLVNTISNNNDIIELKPNSLLDFIRENKGDIKKLLAKEKDLLFDLLSNNSIQELLEFKDHKILRSFIRNNKKFVYSLIYENNPEKYKNIINLYSTYFSHDISKEESILPLIEECFLDDNIPEGWDLCYDKESGSYYYYNEYLNKSMWENPSYTFWREKIQVERKKIQQKKKIYNKEKENESNNLTVLLDIEDIEYSDYYLESSPNNSNSESNRSFSVDSPTLRRSPRIKDLRKIKNNQNIHNSLYSS